ncbi:DUF7426 family protein [Dactylosporangium sp. CA-152071]|uniref:DUF7426 family protein n=1 Tax=Dactylosporangium sp. CA-152071 TaxID=3239933 RepID=UPI003D904842
MGLQLGELDQYFDPGLSFYATGRDDVSRQYTVPLPAADLGLWCVRAAQLQRKGRKDPSKMSPAELDELLDEVEKLPPPPGDQGLTMQERVLGETLAALVDAGVPHHYCEFAFRLAMVWIITSDDPTVEAYYRAGGRPEAPSPANREERRAAARSSGRTSTAAVPETLTAASGSGTRSRKTSSANTAAKAPRGRRSSSTG